MVNKGVTKSTKLPKYVVIRAGQWMVRRCFKTTELDSKGRAKYIAIERICHDQTEQSARDIALQIESEVKAPRIKTATLEQFLESYLDAKKGAISRRTWEATELHLYRLKRLLPMQLDEITPLDIQAQYKALNVTPGVTREIHKKLSAAFMQAVHWDILTKNPCKAVVLPKVEHNEVKAFTGEQAKAFIAECRKTDDNICLEFALETGMRPQEYLALRWSDIEKTTVRVRRALILGLSGGGFSFDDPKTKGSRRDVQISPELKLRLDTQKKRLAEIKRDIARRVRYPKEGMSAKQRKNSRKIARETLANLKAYDLIFPSEVGLPQSINNLNRRKFKAIVAAIGLDEAEFSLYSLRHSSITIDLISGTDVKTVATNHGTSAEVIWKTYAHAMPKQRDQATERKAAALY